MAPVELVGFAGRVVERHVGFGCHGPSILRPSLRIAPDRIVAAVLTQRPKLFVNPDQRQPFTRGLAFVRGQKALDLGLPSPGLRQWLAFSLVGKVNLIGSQYLAHRLFKREFSSSSSFSFLISGGNTPAYFFFQLKQVAWLIPPCGRFPQLSPLHRPASE